MKYGVSLLVVFLWGCSSTNYNKSRDTYLAAIQNNKEADALKLLNTGDFLADKQSRLLRFLEVGKINFRLGNYFQALKAFDEAKELSDLLFTKSIKKQLQAFMANDSEDNYYGEKFERSYIRFYQVLSHFALYQKGVYESYSPNFLLPEKELTKEQAALPNVEMVKLDNKQRLFHLTAARAVLLEWNSMLESYRAISGGEITYKDDLMAKILGSFIHFQLRSRGDTEIAKNLIKQAGVVLFRNYNTYSTYNDWSKKFSDDFAKLPNLPIEKVKANYVRPTEVATNLIKFLDAGSKKAVPNLAIVVEKGMIGKKVAQKFEFPIALTSLPSGVSNQADFMSFITKILHVSAGTQPTISFELPVFDGQQSDEKLDLRIVNEKTQTQSALLPIVAPVSEIAKKSMDESALALKAKIGTRLVAKHVAALATAYLTYKLLIKQGSPEFAALLAAGLEYAASNKIIASSEKADLRHWVSLPMTIYFSSLRLPEGKYNLSIVNSENRVLTSKELIIKKNSKMAIFQL